MKNNKKVPKKYIRIYNKNILYAGVAPMINDVTCSKLQRDRENITNQILSVEHTLVKIIPYNIINIIIISQKVF